MLLTWIFLVTLRFLASPSFAEKGGANVNNDISFYASRKQRNPHNDSNQSLITDYFNVIIHDIEKLAKENKKLSKLLQQ